MEVIAVTGTPGTGKTTLAKALANKLGFYYLDVNKLIAKNRLHEAYDRKRKTRIVDTGKLNKKLAEVIQEHKKSKKYGGVIIDSHLSHYLTNKIVDLCIVTKCEIKELNNRLKKKKFHQGKIKENLQAEIFDVCLNEAREVGHKIIVVDTTKGFNINKLAKKNIG